MRGLTFSSSKVHLFLRPEWWLGAFLVWLTASALRSAGTPFALAAETEWLRWTSGIVLSLLIGFFLPRTKNAVLWAVAGAGVLSLSSATTGSEAGKTLLRGPFGDHQLYGSALLLIFPFTLAAAVKARDERWRLAALTALAAAATCLALSGARSAWLGTAVGAAVFSLFWARSRFNGPKSRRARRETTVLLAATITVVLASAFLFSYAALQGAVSGRAATLHSLAADGSWQARLQTWRGTLEMVEARPLIGFGLGRYPYVQAQWTGIGRVLAPNAAASLSEQAHSLYAQTAAETGGVGLVLYVLALVLMGRQGVLRLRASRWERIQADGKLLPPSSRDALCVAFLSLLAAQAVDAIASPSWQYGAVSVPFWAAVGLGLAACRRADAPAPSVSVSRRPVRQLLAGLAAVAIAAQWTPLALLTPAQAYTTPAGTTFDHVDVTYMPNPASYRGTGQMIAFKMIGYYKRADGTFDTEDMTFDGTDAYKQGTFFEITGMHDSTTAVGTGQKRNILYIGSNETANGASTFSCTSHYVAYNSTGTAKYGTYTISVTINP